MGAMTTTQTYRRCIVKYTLCLRRSTWIKLCILLVSIILSSLYVGYRYMYVADISPSSAKVLVADVSPSSSEKLQSSSQNIHLANIKDTGSKTVIITAALNCGNEELKNFIIPLRRVYGGDIVLLLVDKKPDDVNKFCYENDVTTIPLPPINRYIAYSNVCTNYERCFAIDFRGAFFQTDPFKNITTEYDLIFAAEDSSLTIGNWPHSSEWIKTCWGTDTLKQFSEHNIVSSGAIMGTPKGFSELKDKMLNEMSKKAKQCDCTARDQGYLNYLVYSGSIEVPYTVQKREVGIVNTVGISRRVNKSQINPDGYALNTDGSVPPVLYQYDPYTGLAEVKRVISYSLYDDKPLFVVNAIVNSKLIQKIYPGWLMRIYYDNVSTVVLDRLRSANVELIDMSQSEIKNKMAWRFLVASDTNVERYLIRDIDSRPSEREKAAVNEWIASRKKFHVMRDNKFHDHAINGGMWGGTRDAVPNMKSLLLEQQNMHDDYMQAMNFLASTIWPIAQQSVLQHDGHTCYKYAAMSFPTALVEKTYVGRRCNPGNEWSCITVCPTGKCDPDE